MPSADTDPAYPFFLVARALWPDAPFVNVSFECAASAGPAPVLACVDFTAGLPLVMRFHASDIKLIAVLLMSMDNAGRTRWLRRCGGPMARTALLHRPENRRGFSGSTMRNR